MKYYKYNSPEWKAQQEEIRRIQRTEEEWRRNIKPGEKVLWISYSTYKEAVVKRVTKTKIVITDIETNTWEKDFHKSDGYDFDRIGTRDKILSMNQYNLAERDEALLDRERQRLTYEFDQMSWYRKCYDLDTLRAVRAIIDAADQKKALDNSEKVD